MYDNTSDKHEKEITKIYTDFTYTKITGYIVMYGLVLFGIPYYLLGHSSKTIFITYFANVDIVANILSINFPTYFKPVYNISPTSISEYISYNIISLFALSGIFIHGLSQKNEGMNDLNILTTMIIMSIVTWTLPTQLIPYLVKKTKKRFGIEKQEYDILITTLISGAFIILEGIIISLYLHYSNRGIHKYLSNFEFKF
jgi:hypothetical protein